MLRYSDGTSSVPLGSVPAGVVVTGSHNGRQLEEPFYAGCASFDTGFSADAGLNDAGAWFTVDLDQSHVRITDSVDGTEATVLASDAATITAVTTPDGLEIHASWASDNSVGDIHIECGRNHIDTSSGVAD